MTAFPQPDALSAVNGANLNSMPMKYAGFWRRVMAALIDILILLALMLGAAVTLGPRVGQVNDTVIIAEGGNTIRLSDLAAPRIVVTRMGSATTITETTTATVGLKPFTAWSPGRRANETAPRAIGVNQQQPHRLPLAEGHSVVPRTLAACTHQPLRRAECRPLSVSLPYSFVSPISGAVA